MNYPYEIPAGASTIRVTSPYRIEVLHDGNIFPRFVPDTFEIDSILAVVEKDGWDELDLNAAAAALNESEEMVERPPCFL